MGGGGFKGPQGYNGNRQQKDSGDLCEGFCADNIEGLPYMGKHIRGHSAKPGCGL